MFNGKKITGLKHVLYSTNVLCTDRNETGYAWKKGKLELGHRMITCLSFTQKKKFEIIVCTL